MFEKSGLSADKAEDRCAECQNTHQDDWDSWYKHREAIKKEKQYGAPTSD